MCIICCIENLSFCALSAVSAFFNASCVPGAGTMTFSSLCSRCQGQRSYVPQRNFYCETSHNEPFYHNQGALRFKNTHTTCYTFFFFLLGHTHTNCEPLAFFQMPEVWSRRCGLCGSYSPGQHRWLMHRCFCLFWQRLHQINWYCSVFKASLLIFPTSLSHSLPRSVLNLTSTDSVKDEYRLLCTDGTRVPLSSFRKCNFGRGPGGAVVTRINNQNLARKFLSAIQVMSEPYVC